MFDNLVIGVDGHEGGREAVRLAKQLASAEARVTLAHIYGDSYTLRASRIPLAVQHEDSSALLDREREACWPTAAAVSVRARSVGRGLHELAVQQAADLVVVGSCRHGVIGRVLMGDDARAALNGAPCAIAIAPRGYSPPTGGLAVLGVGYDGSAESERALAVARELAGRGHASVKAMWVVTQDDVRERAPLPADWPSATTAMVDEIQERLRTIGEIDAEAVSGGCDEELAKLSRDTDVVIVGSRGYGPAHCLFHGSVSSYLERHAQCPLVVVPRDAARSDENAPASTSGVSITA